MITALKVPAKVGISGDLRTAVALWFIALLARAAVDPIIGDKHQFVPFYVAMAIAAWVASWRAGVVAAALGLLTIDVFPPISAVDAAPWHVVAAYTTYVCITAFLLMVVHTARRQHDALAARVLTQAVAERHTSDFLALLGHELRNPLATITVAERLIREGKLDTNAQRGTWDMMERQTEQIKRLAGDLLDLARVRQGKLTVDKQPLNVNLMVEEAIADARPVVDGKHQRVIHAPGPADLFVLADRTRMGQVLGNLLHNASKFSPAGSSIDIHTHRTDRRVEITVRDRGIGIPADKLESIFQPFVQLPTGAGAAQGLGLGLPLTRMLVETHGGRVSATNIGVAGGAEFVVELPILPQSQLALLRREPETCDSTQAGPAPIPNGERPLKLLVVDDNTDAAATLALLLRLKGHDARTADDGASALRVAQQNPLDLVFLDIGLPDMNGVEVAMRLRELAIQQPRVVALTGWGAANINDGARAAAFDAHLVKPVSIEDLDRTLLMARRGEESATLNAAGVLE